MNNNTCDVISLLSCTIQLETVEHCTHILVVFRTITMYLPEDRKL